MKKKIFLPIIAMFLAVLWAVPVSAAQFHGGESITISSVEDDVYAGGANIFADGEITGDLYAAGAVVRNNANVSQDVVMAGSVIDLFGDVGDDARLAGSMVTIGGTIEDDLIVFGGMVRLLPGSVVKGDLTVGGGSVMIDGVVEGNVLGGGGQVILNGEVRGSAMLEVDELILGNTAVVGGVMQYKSQKEAKIDEGASVVGGIDHKIPEQPKDDKDRGAYKAPDVDQGVLFGLGVMAFILKVLIGIVTALVGLYFFKKHLLEMTKITLSKFPAQLGWGVVWAIVVPIASIILLITIFGSALGAFALIVYALTFAIAKVLAGLAFGAWIWKLATKAQLIELNWKVALIGVLGLDIIWLVPLLGWVFCMVFTLAALGAVVNYLKTAVKS